MSAWWSYRPTDILMFSERVYWRLFERYNDQLWPLPLLLVLVGLLMLAALRWPRPVVNRTLAGTLTVFWLFGATPFLWYQYAPINWAVRYAVPFFLLQAGLLLWFGVIRDRLRFTPVRGPAGWFGLGLFGYAALVHPWTAPLAGRSLASAEVLGLAPDATAIATLGLVVAAGRGPLLWLLAAVPLFWCLVSWLLLDALGTVEAWIPLLSALAGFVALLLPHGHRSHDFQ